LLQADRPRLEEHPQIARGQLRSFVGLDFPDQGILQRNRLGVSAIPNAVYDSITTIKERVMRSTQLFGVIAAIGSACAT